MSQNIFTKFISQQKHVFLKWRLAIICECECSKGTRTQALFVKRNYEMSFKENFFEAFQKKKNFCAQQFFILKRRN